jgi:hypothetical protein
MSVMRFDSIALFARASTKRHSSFEPLPLPFGGLGQGDGAGAVPNFGAVRALLWVAGCLLLAFWLDGTLPWRYGAAITGLYTLNFALFFVMLGLFGNWCLLWGAPFLLLGYRLANVIDELTDRG